MSTAMFTILLFNVVSGFFSPIYMRIRIDMKGGKGKGRAGGGKRKGEEEEGRRKEREKRTRSKGFKGSRKRTSLF